MDLYNQIIDSAKDLVENYSLIPIDYNETSMYLFSNKNLLIEIFAWRDESRVILRFKKNGNWYEHHDICNLLNNDQQQELLLHYRAIPKDHLNTNELHIVAINRFDFEVLRLKGDEIFLDLAMSWTNKFTQVLTKVSLEEIKKIESIIERVFRVKGKDSSTGIHG